MAERRLEQGASSCRLPSRSSCHGRGPSSRGRSWGSRVVTRPFADARSDDDGLRVGLQRGGRRLAPGLLGREPVEVTLETGGRADDQGPRVGAAQIGKGVRDVARSESQLPLLPCEDLILELEGELAVEYVERLVEVVVVQRWSREAGADDVVHD